MGEGGLWVHVLWVWVIGNGLLNYHVLITLNYFCEQLSSKFADRTITRCSICHVGTLFGCHPVVFVLGSLIVYALATHHNFYYDDKFALPLKVDPRTSNPVHSMFFLSIMFEFEPLT